MPIPLAVPLAIAGATELYKIGHAYNRKRKAEKGLEELQDQDYPQYQTGEQIYDRANAKAKGLSPEEKANAIHQLNQLATAKYNRATQTAPNMAGAINAGINYGSISGQLGLVAEDARKRREDLQRLIGLVGNQSNLQTGADIRKRVSEEQAYGKAISDNDLNMVQGVEGLGSMAFGYGMQENYLRSLDKKIPLPAPSMATPPLSTSGVTAPYMDYRIPQEVPNAESANIYPEDISQQNPLDIIFGKKGRKNPLRR